MNNEFAIKIHGDDNVAVGIVKILAGTDVFGVVAKEDIPVGHKIALVDIGNGADVVKYGAPIGAATAAISAGCHVHTHNLRTKLSGQLEYSYKPALAAAPEPISQNFMGYLRKDGKVGIRNEIWIINTVGCVNLPAQRIVNMARAKHAGRKIDGIHTFVHPLGCSQLGDDHAATQRILANMVHHPNAGGVLVFGLGCENNTIESFQEVLGEIDPNRVKFLVAQDFDDEIAAAMGIIDELVDFAEGFERSPQSVSHLTIGLKCGGSDGFSGITANPLVGVASDMLVARGGTTILTEVPEMFGAEEGLMARCVDEGVFDATVALINDFKGYFMRYNQEVYENPSPGNKDGGISTLEDKSLGCTQKGGTSNVAAVLEYGQAATVPGLNLLNGPGNDIVAITNLMAAGCHIVLFTTGRGTPVGAPVPTVKISSNTDLATRKANWTDFNSGTLLEGKTMEQVGEDFWQYLVEVASGRTTRNEELDYREIAIWKDGVTL